MLHTDVRTAQTRTTHHAPSPTGARILIVDDQRNLARQLRIALEDEARGYQVVDVPSAEEALLEVRLDPPDLLVTDDQLPGMTGVELVQRVQSLWPEVPVIVLADQPRPRILTGEDGYSVDDLLVKPFEVEAFVVSVNALLGDQEVEVDAPPAEPDSLDDAILEQIDHLLQKLQTALGAPFVALIDARAQIVGRAGAEGDIPAFSELTGLLAASLTTTNDVQHRLGGASGATLQVYGGSNFGLYVLGVDAANTLVVLAPGKVPYRMDSVLHYALPAANDLAGLLEDETIAPPPAHNDTPDGHVADDTNGDAPETSVPSGTGELSQSLASLVNALDGADETLFDDLDTFWSQAATGIGKVSEDVLSLDEAIEAGLLPDEELAED
jgi:CheY-like chemotaxis protein